MLQILKFQSNTCPPCRALSPIVNELKSAYSGQVQFQDIDIEYNKELTSKYNVTRVPTLIFIKNGSVVHMHSGMTTKNALVNMIELNK